MLVLGLAAEGPLSGVHDLGELQSGFPGVTTIVETWFEHYKGPGEIVSQGFAPVADAQAILETAMAAWASSR